ncbi:MAG: tellurium resistance protein [Treponema sp. GWB1_62_6]|nr:MAG: tellurium resistance protein [Treponema sp. GWA1_62_8]OHE63243.1 MAG: tellurium resistance protein [Treponema sp. GWB1_62_6]OHE69936.1 MAG: tellurium resistance protein [Treponema sp. GWC1_61_84]OHE70563.1 MAG: tellurium resistance protein [Treponema sp. RIFOXYC1_FULL_61_9]HCM26899.1 toxic anion resistance protein [Treponema sp.]
MADAQLETTGMTKFSAVDMTKVKEIAKGIPIDDSQAIIQYGVGAQAKLSGFAETMLGQIRSHDTGYVGESLTDLMFKIKDVNVGTLSTEKRNWLADLLNGVQRFMARYQKLESQIQKIVDQLSDARMTLLRDITMLDQLYEKNFEYLKELDMFIAAGQMRLDELRAGKVPELEAGAKASNDPADAQKLADFNQFLNRFEKKIHDLKLSRMIAIQTAPQVRLIQNNDQALVEKIQSSILTTIPLWKSQIVIAISLLRQKKALSVQKAVTDATNELLTKNSEMLRSGSVAVATEMERGIVEIETLKKVNEDLISTIEETIRIQEDGKAKRAQAETELRQIESDLKTKLMAVRG